ncbi:MAG TPA: hypothetical protein VMV69_00080 [Pirellulales bacterium]|nr:hypothetical protein [Pirellulales bacterium]
MSVVNSIVFLTGESFHFVIGLGVADFIIGIGGGIAQINAPQVATIAKVVSFIACLGIAGIFAFFAALDPLP